MLAFLCSHCSNTHLSYCAGLMDMPSFQSHWALGLELLDSSAVPVSKFLIIIKQGVLHFHLALGPTQYVTASSPCTGLPITQEILRSLPCNSPFLLEVVWMLSVTHNQTSRKLSSFMELGCQRLECGSSVILLSHVGLRWTPGPRYTD